MQKIILLYILLIVTALHAQNTPLYKGLLYKMPLSEAKKEFRKNKDQYKVISLGNGVDWRMYPMNFAVNGNSELVGINLNSGAMFGESSENTKIYLTQTRQFLEDKGYTVIHEPDYWNFPLLFSDANKYGLLLHDPDKNVMISIRSVPHPTEHLRFVPVMGISNYDAFVKYMETDKEAVQKQRDKTGF